MKNVFLVQTNNPSRLLISNGVDLIYAPFCGFDFFDIANNYQHQDRNELYITNNDELNVGDMVISSFNSGKNNRLTETVGKILEITDNYYFIQDDTGIVKLDKNNLLKIILTTDNELINNGIQQINDLFIEWYLKNPTCTYLNDGDYEKMMYYIIPEQEIVSNEKEEFKIKELQLYTKETVLKFAEWLIRQDITERGVGKYINYIGDIVTTDELFEKFIKL